MKSGEMGRRQLRLALWIIGTGAATALASAMPATDRWPLPTGLGGVVGDGILAATKAVTGMSGLPASAILGMVFALVAILALSAACGLGLSPEPHRDVAEDFDETILAPVARPSRSPIGTRRTTSRRTSPGWGSCPWAPSPTAS